MYRRVLSELHLFKFFFLLPGSEKNEYIVGEYMVAGSHFPSHSESHTSYFSRKKINVSYYEEFYFFVQSGLAKTVQVQCTSMQLLTQPVTFATFQKSSTPFDCGSPLARV